MSASLCAKILKCSGNHMMEHVEKVQCRIHLFVYRVTISETKNHALYNVIMCLHENVYKMQFDPDICTIQINDNRHSFIHA